MAFSQVQVVKATSTATASTAVTKAFTSSVTTGNRLFMFTDANSSTGVSDIATPTKSAGTATVSAFTQLVSASVSNGVGGKQFVDLWTATVTTGGTCTLSATSTSASGSELGWSAAEYSGLDSSAGSGCLDVSATGTGNTNTTANASTGTTAATHAANQLGLCMVGDDGVSATWTLNTANGFTKDTGLSQDADANAGIGIATKTSASGATESAIWTNGAVSDIDIAWVAVIKLASVAATAVPNVYAPPPRRRTTYRGVSKFFKGPITPVAIPPKFVSKPPPPRRGKVRIFKGPINTVPIPPRFVSQPVRVVRDRRGRRLFFKGPITPVPQPTVIVSHVPRARRGKIQFFKGPINPVAQPTVIVSRPPRPRRGVLRFVKGPTPSGGAPVALPPVFVSTVAKIRRRGKILFFRGTTPPSTVPVAQTFVSRPFIRRVRNLAIALRGHTTIPKPTKPVGLYVGEIRSDWWAGDAFTVWNAGEPVIPDWVTGETAVTWTATRAVPDPTLVIADSSETWNTEEPR